MLDKHCLLLNCGTLGCLELSHYFNTWIYLELKDFKKTIITQICCSCNRAWQLPCGHSWTCTSEQEYQRFRLGPQPGCPDIMPVNATQPPAPGRCEIVDGTCQFTTYLLQCTSWVNTCQIRYQCGSIEEHAAYLNSSESHCGLFQPLPKPNSLCLPISNTCQWYNPCASWRGHCLSGYNCGTADEYYAFLYGPHPLCAQPPPGWTEPLPPGECQLDSSAQCSWSSK